MNAGVWVSLQTLRIPLVPPGGWLTKRTSVSLAVVVPRLTVTLRAAALLVPATSRLDGMTVIDCVSVVPPMGSASAPVVEVANGRLIPDVQVKLPPVGLTLVLTVAPTFGTIAKLNVLPVMPFAPDLQISSVP